MNKDRIAMIREMRDQGMTLRQIAKVLGISAGSVSGIMSRNRSVFPIVDRRMAEIKLPPEKRSFNAVRKLFHEVSKAPLPAPIGNAKEYDQYRLSQAKSLHELTKRECCWPLLDTQRGETQMFCGEVKASKNYCRFHEARAWRQVA